MQNQSVDNLYNSIALRLNCLNEAFLVAAIDHDGLDPGAELHKPPHQWYATDLIRDSGAPDFNGKQTSIGVDSDMTLMANDFLGSIVASFTLRRVAFDGLSIDDDKGWTRLTP